MHRDGNKLGHWSGCHEFWVKGEASNLVFGVKNARQNGFSVIE